MSGTTLYGAVVVSRAGSVFCFQSTVQQEASGKFLAQIAAQDPAAVQVVIQDGAGFHLPENDPRLPANGRIIPLPACSPELNPVEKLWDHLKDAISNRVLATVEELRAALSAWLKAFWRRPGALPRRSRLAAGFSERWHQMLISSSL